MRENELINTSWPRLGTDGPDAYLAVPARRPARGAVVVAMELFGLTGYLRGICDRLAGLGYAALAPDFFWRTQRLAEFGYDQAGRDAGMVLLRGLDRTEVLADLALARDAVTGFAGTDRVALAGFSAGGHLAVLGATALPASLVISCYGGWTLNGGIPLAEPVAPLADPANLAFLAEHDTFVLAVVGDQDHVIPVTEWQAIEAALTDASVAHELVSYPGVRHGFLGYDRPAVYDEPASADTWHRIESALAKHLG